MTTKYKKAQESLTSNKLITMILLILVILGVLMFLMKPQFLDWIKNLPGYEGQPDTNISIVGGDQNVNACVLTALIGEKDLSHWYELGMDRRSLSIYRINQTRPEVIQIVVEIKSKETVQLLKTASSGILIGQIAKGKLTITPDLITNYQTSEIKSEVSLPDLKLLDGSVFITATKLCKVVAS